MFPTRDYIDGIRRLTHLWSVRDALLSERPESAERLELQEVPPYLAVALPSTERIVYALVSEGHRLTWNLVHPGGMEAATRGGVEGVIARLAQLVDQHTPRVQQEPGGGRAE